MAISNFKSFQVIQPRLLKWQLEDLKMSNVTGTTHQNSNSSPTTLTQYVIALNEPISPTLKPLISVEEFLRSAPKVNTSDLVSHASDVQSKNQLSYSLLPSPSDNSVIFALKTLGLYIRPLGIGKHLIFCPWVNEHTKGRESTIYFEPSVKYEYGGFNCPHHHCSHLSVKHLKAYLGKAIAASEASAK